MSRPARSHATALTLVTLTLTLVACRDNGVQYREVPRETPAAAPAASPHGAMAQAPAPAGPSLEWDAPAAWTLRPASDMRLATYTYTAADGTIADISVFAFPDAAGGLLANINRWRAQIGLEPVPPDALETTATRTEIAGQVAWLVDLVGEASASIPTMGDGPAPTGITRTIGAIVPISGRAWFFKMMGPDATVASQRENFAQLVSSIRAVTPAHNHAPTASGAMPAGVDPHAGIPGAPPLGPTSGDPHAGVPGAPPLTVGAGADPHAGVPGAPPLGAGSMNPAAIPAPGTPITGFTFEVPSGWESLPATQFRLASFRIAGPDGLPPAEMVVSNFPGTVGGDFANINRWRGQLGLPPLTQGEFPAAVRRVTGIHDVEFVVAEFESTQPRIAGTHRERMIAAILKQPDSTWFFKLQGESALVAGQRAAFERFLQSFHIDDHAH